MNIHKRSLKISYTFLIEGLAYTENIARLYDDRKTLSEEGHLPPTAADLSRKGSSLGICFNTEIEIKSTLYKQVSLEIYVPVH